MNSQVVADKARQRTLNPQTLDRLRKVGSDLGKPHSIFNTFHVFSNVDVEQLCQLLEGSGYSIENRGEPQSFEGTDYWLVVAQTKLVPTVDSLETMTDDCVELASEFDADYDGWYTEVVPVIA